MSIFSLANGPFEIIKNMIIFEDERMHISFLDKTSLIIHSGGVCGTYFKADSKSLRFFLNVPPIKEDLTFKIESSFALYNSFSNKTLLNPNYKNLFKTQPCSEQIDKYNFDLKNPKIFIDKNYYEFLSNDENCSLTLYADGIYIKVEQKHTDVTNKYKKYNLIESSKIFSIYNCPEKWLSVLTFLIKHLSEEEKIDFPYLPDEINLQHDFSGQNYILVNSLENVRILSYQQKNIAPVNDSVIWKNDKYPPNTELISYEEKVTCFLSTEYFFTFSNYLEIILFSFEDCSLYFSTTDVEYFHQLFKNEEHSEKVYTTIKTPNFINIELIKRIRKKNLLLNQRKVDSKIISPEIIELLHKSENEYGSYRIFNNQMIRFVFKDRTILKIHLNENSFEVLSRLGITYHLEKNKKSDFQDYFKIAYDVLVDFLETPEEKYERVMTYNNALEKARNEIEKNDRFLHILNANKNVNVLKEINMQPEQNISYNLPIISKELSNNEKYLESISKLLKK